MMQHVASLYIKTWIFSKMYCPDEYQQVEPYFTKVLSEKKPYDLYILLKPDCEPIQDGTRNFLDERWEHYEVIKSEMISRNYNFIEIGGDWESRYKISKEMVSTIFNIDEKKILPIKK